MSIWDLAFLACIVLAFGVFGGVLAWGVAQTSGLPKK
jgi:hypothetical protein